MFQNLAVQHRVIEGMEGIRAADLGLRPRMLRLIHKVDRAEDVERGLKPGYLQLGNDPCVPSLEVVLLKGAITRVFMEGDGPSARATCGSPDGRQPYDFLVNPKSPECPPCPYAQWETNPQTGKRVPPPCQRAVVFLGLEGLHSQNGPTPFWWVCKRTSFQPAQTFMAELQQSPQIGSLRELRIRITTERKAAPGGGVTYYVPVFSIAGHDPSQRNTLRKLFELARDVNYTHGLADDGAPDDEHADDGTTIEAEVVKPSQAEAANGGIPF
jgi:hypothetical protein